MPNLPLSSRIDAAHWREAAGRPVPDARDGRLHLWHVDLDHPDGHDPAAWSPLEASELERAARFRFPQHAARYRVAHLRLRAVLGAASGRAPGSLRFDLGPHGRPSLQGEHDGLTFNLAHSGPHGLIGWCRGGDLGVDIELPRPSADLLDIARQHYDAEEALQVEQGGDAAFFACWTRKEAVLKAWGTGLLTPLADVHVGARPDHVPVPVLRAGVGLPPVLGLHAGTGPAGTVVAAALVRAAAWPSCWQGAWGAGDA